ncbi:MAG: PilZ domain-containing protein [Candidatus Omnitrophota bacterium]
MNKDANDNKEPPKKQPLNTNSEVGRVYSIPYLPLDNYAIDDCIIDLVPVEIVKKYSIMPVDKLNDNLSLVMENPLDEKAIKAVEDITGCKVRRLLGTHEEIQLSIKQYYGRRIKIEEPVQEKEKTVISTVKKEQEKLPPAPAQPAADANISDADTGEKRGFFRFKRSITISFPAEGSYQQSETFDISYSGLSFKSLVPISVGSYMVVQLGPFRRDSDCPIVLLVQVMRRIQIDEKAFFIGARILQTTKENINKIVNYASSHEIDAYSPFDRINRRKYPRFKTKFDLWFPDKDDYSKAETTDVGFAGISFTTKHALKVGSYLPLQMALPEDICKHPLALLVQVVRSRSVQSGIFQIGAKIINVGESEIEELIKYISRNENL